ncbi:demethoxyubiquinone hydroxylase family protein [Stutzerimonas marianensis]|uniref:demethoxyubiquinone hydroxylase family protein n=1 Tax=Stutzerimonas marianensis TaxID=2929513 RepID=UPI003C30D61A
MNLDKELRIMHACEVGATGVYRGHKCVARYFFRSSIPDLDDMRLHEKDHTSIFMKLLMQRNARPCFAYKLFFIAGLIYGALIGLLGIKAIGASTSAIEEIVNIEIEIALGKFKGEPHICELLRAIQLEEKQHQDSGNRLVGDGYVLYKSVQSIAKAGAYTAKNVASLL